MEERLKKCLAGSANWIAGAVAFPSVLAAAQTYLWKPLRVSYSPTVRSSLIGLASVGMASIGASSAALGTIYVVQKSSYSSIKLAPTYEDLLISTLGGIVLFKAVGGQYGRVLPSNLMRPGAFAVDWVPAMNESARATPKERKIVNYLGSKHGCHTCGGKNRVTYIADHQPPSKLLGNHRNGKKPVHPNPLLQRFYPQCLSCSHTQGGLLAAQNGISAIRHPRAIITHAFNFWNLRAHHLLYCLPIPLCVAYMGTKSRKSQRTEFKPAVKVKTPDESPKSSKEKEVSKESKESKVASRRMSPDTWLDVEVMLNFPLFIMWQRMVQFLDSFHDPLTTFHVTLWAFIIIAALGTI